MRLLFAICLAGMLLLAAGCAANRPEPEVAPSRQAKLDAGNPGWSVPPGQTTAADPGPGGDAADAVAADEAALADEMARAEAERKAREDKARKARERLERERTARAETGDERAPAAAPEQRRRREPAVKPIVPAFPARAGEERVRALRTVHFAFDSWALSEGARSVLEDNVAWLKANPGVNVQVEGHADERGTNEYNMALGERRAKKVRDYLLLHGVAPERLATVSYGEEMPLDAGHNERAWARNRRAEFSRVAAPQVSQNTQRR